MLIDPDFLDHWRTRALVDLLGDEMAPVYLIRLWSHCQHRKSDTFEIPTVGLKALCRYPGDAQALEAAMSETGWIERNGRNLTACKWLEKNSGLKTAWDNGNKGGRPKKPDRNPRVTHGLPTGNRTVTGSKPIGEDKREEEEKKKKTPPAVADGADEQAVISFDEWWKSYPIRPGAKRGNRTAAFREWVKLPDLERARVLEATKRLIASGQYPKAGELFLKAPRGVGDKEYETWLEDTAGAPVASSGIAKQTHNERKEADNEEYDDSWLRAKANRAG